MSSNELMELRKITKILTLAHGDSLERAIAKYASTDNRKIIWVLIDGSNMPNDIIRKMGTTRIKRRTVYDFLEVLEEVKLIVNPKRKPPKRLIDFVPSSWIELYEKKAKEKRKQPKVSESE